MTEQESREQARKALAELGMPEASIVLVLGAARAQAEVMTKVPGHGNARVEYRAGLYTVTP